MEAPREAAGKKAVSNFGSFIINLVVAAFELGSHSVSIENKDGGQVAITFSNSNGSQSLKRLSMTCDYSRLEAEVKESYSLVTTVTKRDGSKVVMEGEGVVEKVGRQYRFRIKQSTRKDKTEKIFQAISFFPQTGQTN